MKRVLCAALVIAAGCKSNAPSTSAPGAAPHDNAPAASAGDTILVGEVGSMTGAEATFGTSSDNGIRLAVKELNAAGGIKGKKLAVKVLDDEGKPEEAATAVTKLITSDHVAAILGEVASTRSLFMADVAQRLQVPMVSPSSTNPKVTEKGDFIFRTCFIDPFQGEVIAKFAKTNLKVDKVAILRDVRNDYSVGLANFFTDTFKKEGGTIVGDESYSAGDVDFRAQLTKLKGLSPQALIIPGYYTDVALIARQARELGINVPMLGGDGWDSPKLTEMGGVAIEGSYFVNHYSVEDPSPRVQGFIAKYKAAAGGQVPDSLAAQAYDTMLVLADAMKRAKDLSGPAVRDALAATKDFPGVTGDITIDDKRNARKAAVVLKIAPGGKYEFVQKILP